MAADNVTANPGASGSIFRTLSDGTNEWPASVLAWPTTISPGANVLQLVDGTHGLPVAVIGTVVLGAGAAALGTVGVTSLPALPTGSNTIGTVNLGTIAGIALDATLAKLNVAQGNALGSNTGPMVQGSVTTAAPSYTTGQVSPVSLTTAGLLRVDASGVNVPVTGTFWQATQPVSAASLPLPSGASTAAKQPALGTAGSASTDVISVQGIASMTALKVDGSAATQPISGTITANAGTGTFAVSGTVSTNADAAIGAGAAPSKSLVVGGVFNSSAPAPTTGQTVALQLDSAGLLKVNVAAGGASGGTSSSFGAAFPATGTAIGFKDSGGTNLAAGNLDASGFLKVNVAAGSSGNAASSATGSAVPAQADYGGLNVAGTLRGQTGANPSGSIFAAQTDLSSIAGTTADTNSGVKSAGTLRVVLATDQPALTNALKVDGSAVTQPVSAASLPLPSGASTAAKQPALGTAGSASTDVISVQGIASMTALKVDGSGVTQPVSGTVTANAGTGTFTVSGTVTANAGTGTLAVKLADDTATGTVLNVNDAVTLTLVSGRGTVAIDASVFATGTIVIEGSVDGSTWRQLPVIMLGAGNPSNASTITGVGGYMSPCAGMVKVRARVSVGLNATGTITLDAGIAPTGMMVLGSLPSGTNSIGNIGSLSTLTNALPTGANTIGAVTQASGPWTNNVIQVGGTAIDTNSGTKSAGTIRMVLATDQPALTNALKVDGSAVTQPVSGTVTINAIPTGTNAIGTVQPGNTANTTPWLVTDTPATSGGLSFSHVTSAASNNKTQAKASAGQLFSIMATNTNAAVRYLKIFNNTSAGVTMGTTAADYQFAIPGNTAGAGLMINIDKGIAMGTGITYAITAAVSLTDNTSISANDCCVTLGYK